MFGFYRFLLASFVMSFHLLHIPIIGTYAVFSFFILSGFLMTLIMHENYGYTYRGVKYFAINRFLRLFPIYWVVIIFSLLLLLNIPTTFATAYHKALYIPNDLFELIYNISMIFPSLAPLSIEPRLSPAAWALTVEIFYYILIALGLSRTKYTVFFWLAGSTIYFLITYALGLDQSARYNIVFAASLPFSLGSLLYFYKEKLYIFLNRYNSSNPIFWLFVYVINAIIFLYAQNNIFLPEIQKFLLELGTYLNMLVTLLVINVLFYRGSEYISFKKDKILGDMSYPIYLLHWPLGLFVAYIFFDSPKKGFVFENIIIFFMTLLFTVIFVLALIMPLDKKITKIRKKIKNR